MAKNEVVNSNPFAIRFRPDFRYRNDKLISIGLSNFVSTEPSVTDKEAYRITLASLRGEIAQAAGGSDVGSYSLKPGEEYDFKKDFSFLNRKDLTIVELDDYIKVMRRHLEEEDTELSEQIKAELAAAEKKREVLSKEQKDENTKAE